MGSPLSPLPRSPRPAVTPRNQILGSEFAGEVEAIGSAATRFKQGDQVFGYVGQSMGAYAEYVGLPEDGAVIINPINLTCEEAVVISYGAIMALNLLRKANSQPTRSPEFRSSPRSCRMFAAVEICLTRQIARPTFR